MKKLLGNRFGIIQKTILVLAVLAMSIVWPLGAFPVHHVSEGMWDGARMSGPSSEESFVRQEFSPNFEQLDSVSVYVCNSPDSFDTMKSVFRLYDYQGICLKEIFFQLEDQKVPGYVRIPVDLKLNPGTLYYYTVGGVDGELIIAYSDDDAKAAENGALFYKEVPAGGTSAVTAYEYRRPMGLKRILLCDGLIAFAAFGLILLTGFLRNRLLNGGPQKEEVWKRAEKIVRYVITGLILLGVLVSFYGIAVRKLFTDDILNIVVLFAGVLIAAAWLLFLVFHVKSELEPLTGDEKDICTKGTAILRSLLFAGTVLMCCMYLNGGNNYEKGLYVRRILIFFALFLISTGKRKQIFNIFSFLWSAVALGFGKYYISLHSDHIEHLNTATGEAWVIWGLGLVLIQFIYRIREKDFRKLKQLSISCTVLCVAFWLVCAAFANGRSWPVMLCIVFTAWIFFYVTSEYREELLEDICNGILLAFAGTVIFCLYRRPYQYFMLTRYAGIFFTVTVTACYYLLPAAAALTKVFVARREENREKLLSSWLLFGVVAAYMAFTASRTGIISMAVMLLIAFVVSILQEHREKGWVRRQFARLGILIISVVSMFVMTFSMTRMIPAMAGNPFYFFFERPGAYFTSETPWKGGETPSETYIDVERSFEMLFGRVFEGNLEENSVEIPDNKVLKGPLLVSAEITADMLKEASAPNYANGRLDIFEAYIKQLNMTGHETMSAIAENGEELMHAHNSYLQVAFDFGIPVGILFLAFCACDFVRAFIMGVSLKREKGYKLLILFIVTGFGAASMFEWVYHPCNPLGFMFLLLLAPVMMKKNAKCKKQE